MKFRKLIALAGVCSLMLTAAGSNFAQAQQRVGSDGRAMDANQRAGSNGINDARPAIDFPPAMP